MGDNEEVYTLTRPDPKLPTIEKNSPNLGTVVRTGDTIRYYITVSSEDALAGDFIVRDVLDERVARVANSIQITRNGTPLEAFDEVIAVSFEEVTTNIYASEATANGLSATPNGLVEVFDIQIDLIPVETTSVQSIFTIDEALLPGVIEIALHNLPANSQIVISFEVTVLAAAAGQTVRNAAVLQLPLPPGAGPNDPAPSISTPSVDIPIQAAPTPGPTPGPGAPIVAPEPPITPPPPEVEEEPDPSRFFSPYHNAFIIGFPDGTISPHASITRAEVVTILFRLLNDDFRTRHWNQQNDFTDVSASAWFNNAISTMADAGIVQGAGGEFRPNDAVTRAEFAAMIARFFRGFEASNGTFTDVEGIWAADYINLIAQFGWVEGVGDGQFNPNVNMSRAEAAAIVNRMLGRIIDSTDDLLPNRTRWPDKTDMNAWYYLYLQEATHSTTFERLPNGNIRWVEILPHLDWTVLERPNASPDAIITARATQQA